MLKNRKRKIKYFYKLSQDEGVIEFAPHIVDMKDFVKKNNEPKKINININGQSIPISAIELINDSGERYFLTSEPVKQPTKKLDELNLSKEDFSKEETKSINSSDFCKTDYDLVKNRLLKDLEEKKEVFERTIKRKNLKGWIWDEDNYYFYKNPPKSETIYDDVASLFTDKKVKKEIHRPQIKVQSHLFEHFSETLVENIAKLSGTDDLYFKHPDTIEDVFNDLKKEHKKFCDHYEDYGWLFAENTDKHIMGGFVSQDLCVGPDCSYYFETYYHLGCGYYYISSDDNEVIIQKRADLPREREMLYDNVRDRWLIVLSRDDLNGNDLKKAGNINGCEISDDKKRKSQSIRKEYIKYITEQPPGGTDIRRKPEADPKDPFKLTWDESRKSYKDHSSPDLDIEQVTYEEEIFDKLKESGE
jgi:hypothetical protein